MLKCAPAWLTIGLRALKNWARFQGHDSTLPTVWRRIGESASLLKFEPPLTDSINEAWDLLADVLLGDCACSCTTKNSG